MAFVINSALLFFLALYYDKYDRSHSNQAAWISAAFSLVLIPTVGAGSLPPDRAAGSNGLQTPTTLPVLAGLEERIILQHTLTL